MHRILQRKYEVAVLPVGATEAHNRHLPQGMDNIEATYIARRCCEAAWEKTQSVICLPTLGYGVDCNQMAYPLTIHVSQATLDAIVREIIISLRKHGIRKVVIINGHGGNEFKPFIRQIQSEMDVHVFLCDFWQVALDKYDEIFTKPDDQAGQMETSLAMAVCPELVEPGVAGNGKSLAFRFKALRRGWVKTSRDFSRINDHCAAGAAGEASAEKGREYLDIICRRISQFLIELAQARIDEFFPHNPTV